MANLGSSRGRVAIDTVPLPEKGIGMPTKKGKLLKKSGQYYVSVAGKRTAIPPNGIVFEKDIAALVNKDVYVAFSMKSPTRIVAIGTWPTPEKPRFGKRWIICYIPAPDILKGIQPQVQELLLRKMVDERVITERLRKTILGR